MSTKMYRKTTCKGCGYSQETNTTYYQDKKMWNAKHSLAHCRSRKAFNEMMGNPLDLLAELKVTK